MISNVFGKSTTAIDKKPAVTYLRVAGKNKEQQLRRRLQPERHTFAYLTMKNNTFAHFARAIFIFGNFADVLVLPTT